MAFDITLIAMDVPEHLPDSSRSGKRWGLAAVASAGVCVLCFAYLNWDGCWFYWNRARGLAGFALLWRFEYAPSISANGTIGAYAIKATPLRRPCGCARSLTIANDGRLDYTLQERAATASDELLQ